MTAVPDGSPVAAVAPRGEEVVLPEPAALRRRLLGTAVLAMLAATTTAAACLQLGAPPLLAALAAVVAIAVLGAMIDRSWRQWIDRPLAELLAARVALQQQVDEAAAALETRSDALVTSYQRMFALREQLARAQQAAAAGQTAASLAHQIATPLTLISGYVQMMMEEARGSGARARLDRLQTIEDQIRKVTAFVRATLDAVRGPAAPHEPVFPGAVVRRLAEVARPRLAAARIDLTLEIEDDLPWLMGDTVQLELALLNLINNSLEAMPDGGALTLTAHRSGGGTAIEVADTGPGIPSDLLPRIFEPWVTSKPPGRGTGLGLSIARDVLLAHGGTIAVRSREGRGTVFTVALPGQPGAPAVREV